ncbi:HAD family hydrolase [Arthrobacter sp. 2MCAF14]|uniref:HAD family hydrolase n=1 Tax=Arthrobacter sp. 2MCAF14 TaxID=3232982 RepID=UPI003F90C381
MVAVGLFDLDGTLLHTPRAIAEAMADSVQAVTGKTVPHSEALALVGLPLQVITKTLAQAVDNPGAAEGILEAYMERFQTVIIAQAPSLVCDGVLESLRALCDSDVAIGVVTSKIRRSAEAILDAAGLLEHFDLVVGADDIAQPKPSPDGILFALERLRATNSASAFYVGDTAHDMGAAKAAGTHAIGVTYGVGTSKELLNAGAELTLGSFIDACICGGVAIGRNLDLTAH